MKLSTRQINDFHDDGFLVLKKFAKTALCDAICEKAQEHLDDQIMPFESEQEYLQTSASSLIIRRLRQVYDRDDIFSQWMKHEAILPILTQLLQDTPTLLLAHHNSIMTKHSFMSSATPWHQDIRYWNYENDELVSVWLSLGDEFIDNGLLEFIPGSHKMCFDSKQFDDRSNFRDD
ncbi:Protein involved in biosynthesis of mitomycin antibiotics/polyketide fumonisin, partial [hydrothermal vent metagenome]